VKSEIPAKVAKGEKNKRLNDRTAVRSNFKDSNKIIYVKKLKKQVEQDVYEVPSRMVAEKMLSLDIELNHFVRWIKRTLV